MSTVLNTEGKELDIPAAERGAEFRVALIVARWNSKITGALADGALDVFHRAGVNTGNITVYHVPGTVELVNAAALAVNSGRYDAVIVIGCVIRGDTPHFDYVCQSAAQGIAELNAKGEAPVIFGVLTTNTEQQALDRAGGCLGNKGAEAAVAAIEMSNLHCAFADFENSRKL